MSGNCGALILTARCLNQHFLGQNTTWRFLNGASKRYLSVNETAIALRPFLFMVHPDLFGQFPKERANNEQSLKLLNEYIGKLHCRQDVKPLSLLFYMREKSASQQARNLGLSADDTLEGLRSIRLLLVANTLSDTVRSILGACALPLDYINSIKSLDVKEERPSKNDSTASVWETVANAMAGRRFRKMGLDFVLEFQQRPQRASKDKLNDWLRKNIIKAHQRNLLTLPVRQDIRKLKELVQEQTGATDVRWESNWAQASFRTALRGLLRIYASHSGAIDLKDRIVVFGNDSGVCIRGNIVLRYDSVPEGWTRVLTSLHKHNGALNRIPSMEKYLSSLLGDIDIVSRSYLPVVSANEYLHQLLKLVDSVQAYKESSGAKALIHADLDGVELVVECATGPLMISQSGQILVPTSCPAFLVIDFINNNASKAREICQEFKRCEKEHREIVNRCHAALGLESLTSDSNISRQQMVSCCSQLLKMNDMKTLDVDLTSCHVKVTSFYSVMSEGDICIPWNFEEIF